MAVCPVTRGESKHEKIYISRCYRTVLFLQSLYTTITTSSLSKQPEVICLYVLPD